MKRFTKGILIFALLLFIGGSGCMIAGFVMGITSDDLERMVKDLPFVEFDQEIMITDEELLELPDRTKKDDEEMISASQSFSKEQVSYIELDLANVTCTISQSENDQILVHTSDNSKVNVFLKGDRLEIERNNDVFKNESTAIDLYLPEELFLREFDLQAGAGDITINCPIEAKEISMEIGASSVHMNGKLTADEVSIELGAGMADFDLIDAKRVTLENGVGQTNLGLIGSRDSYHVTIESAAGSVQYGEENFSGLADTYDNSPKDADRLIRIESALGQVVVTFKEEV